MNDEWSLLELFRLGGVFMWPLLAFSVATIALAIERTAYLLYHNMNVSTMKKEVLSRISAGDREGAADWLRAQPRRNTAATIFLAILANARHGENRMEKAAEAEQM